MAHSERDPREKSRILAALDCAWRRRNRPRKTQSSPERERSAADDVGLRFERPERQTACVLQSSRALETAERGSQFAPPSGAPGCATPEVPAPCEVSVG